MYHLEERNHKMIIKSCFFNNKTNLNYILNEKVKLCDMMRMAL